MELAATTPQTLPPSPSTHLLSNSSLPQSDSSRHLLPLLRDLNVKDLGAYVWGFVFFFFFLFFFFLFSMHVGSSSRRALFLFLFTHSSILATYRSPYSLYLST